jgi:hypothetical protein
LHNASRNHVRDPVDSPCSRQASANLEMQPRRSSACGGARLCPGGRRCGSWLSTGRRGTSGLAPTSVQDWVRSPQIPSVADASFVKSRRCLLRATEAACLVKPSLDVRLLLLSRCAGQQHLSGRWDMASRWHDIAPAQAPTCNDFESLSTKFDLPASDTVTQATRSCSASCWRRCGGSWAATTAPPTRSTSPASSTSGSRCRRSGQCLANRAGAGVWSHCMYAGALFCKPVSLSRCCCSSVRNLEGPRSWFLSAVVSNTRQRGQVRRISCGSLLPFSCRIHVAGSPVRGCDTPRGTLPYATMLGITEYGAVSGSNPNS